MRKIIFTALLLCLIPFLSAQNVTYLYSGDSSPLEDKKESGLNEFKLALEAVGLSINAERDLDFEITHQFMEAIDVLILGSNTRSFTLLEQIVLREWVEIGGSVVAWPGKNKLTQTIASDNALMEQFGITFSQDSTPAPVTLDTPKQQHFTTNKESGEALITKAISHSHISSKTPAIAIANNQAEHATLAIAKIKKGRVVGLFDESLFYNKSSNSNISMADNREFAQRIALWACANESEERIQAGKPVVRDTVNKLPIIQLQYYYSVYDQCLYIETEIKDNDNDGIYAEITWMQTEGPGTGTFEGNNPNTLNPCIHLPKVGRYVFKAQITDGKYKLYQYVRCKRDD